ncbi:MAG: glycosyltransferase family 4 protein [Patescibacteria group bacterium]|nr:glycosyltransferase family 4 protein [Patescibacteria group bacterium]
MHIGIDGNEANVETLVGVSVYTHKLLTAFSKKATADLRFTVYLKHRPLPHMPPATEHFCYRVVPGPVLWSRIFFPLALRAERDLDVLFAPAHYSPAGIQQKLVVTIHDLSYFYYPAEFLKKDLYKLTRWTEASIRAAQRIITVSKTTKKDVMHYYGVPSEAVTVVYNGFEKELDDRPDTRVLREFALTRRKYFLCVGTVQPRKNIVRLIEAFRRYRTTRPDMHLVITGKKGWLFEDIVATVTPEDGNSIVFTGFLPDEQVVALYRNALAFVLPSLYEGFGIPMLEAMAQGCPVIASQTASLPEIGADACLYFNPEDPADIADKLERISDDAGLRKELVTSGRRRVKNFSWARCAEETLAVLTAVAGASGTAAAGVKNPA